MAWKFNVLVVANVTADAPELIGALKERASRDTCAFTLLVPAPASGSVGRDAAQERLESALAAMREAGLDVEGKVGDHDAIAAVHEAWDPSRYDEVVISTLPTGVSKWLQVDLPHRVEKLTGGSQVTHVVAEPPRPEPATTPAPKPEKQGVLAPLVAAFTSKR
ncbi:MAG: hypothetical protein ACJ766_01190 [Thermoleophilaceae bacterium]